MAGECRNDDKILDIESSDANSIVVQNLTVSAKPPSRDFKETPKYHDIESYIFQRHHFIGSGVFNTDELDDLPPRYRDKVLRAYQKAAADLAARYPQALADHIAPTVSDLIACDMNIDTSSEKSYNSQRGQKQHLYHCDSQSGEAQQSHQREIQKGNFKRQNTTSISRSSDHVQDHHKTTQSGLNLDIDTSSEKSFNSRRGGSQQSHHKQKGNFDTPNTTGVNHSTGHNQNHKTLPSSRDSSQSIYLSRKENQSNHNKALSKSTYSNDCDRILPSPQNQKHRKELSETSDFHNDFNHQQIPKNNSQSLFSQSRGNNSSVHQSHRTGEGLPSKSKNKDTRTEPLSSQIYQKDKNVKNQNTRVKATKKALTASNYKNINSVRNSRNGIVDKTGDSRRYESSKDFDSKISHHDQERNLYGKRRDGHKNENNSDTRSWQGDQDKHLVRGSGQQYSSTTQDSEFETDREIYSSCTSDNPRNVSKRDTNKGKFNENNFSRISHEKNPDRMEILQNESQAKAANKKISEESNHHNRTNFNNSRQPKHKSPNKNSSENFDLHEKFVSDSQNLSMEDKNSYRYPNASKQQEHTSVTRNHPVKNNYPGKFQKQQREEIQLSAKNAESLALERQAYSRGKSKNNSRFIDTEDDLENKLHSRSNSQSSNVSQLSSRTGDLSDNGSYDDREIPGFSKNTSSTNNKRPNFKQGPTKISDSASLSSSKSKQQESDDVINTGTSNSKTENYSHSLTKPAKLILDVPPGFDSSTRHRLEADETRNKCLENGFFVHVNVSKNSNELDFWQTFFETKLEHKNFSLDYCCKFTESLILNFDNKNSATQAVQVLRKVKNWMKDIREPHLVIVSNLKYKLVKPCKCEDKMIESSLQYFRDYSEKYIREHHKKIAEVKDELKLLSRKRNKKTLTDTYNELNLKDALETLIDMEHGFRNYVTILENKVKTFLNYLDLCKLKINFSHECNSFKRCLPVYARKAEILKLLNSHSVTVISAETGSGKTTQLAEYLLQSWVAERGTIICTQPRKIAAISVATYVCSQIGTSVGKLVGYDVGIERKYDEDTKIIYMTDYALLKKLLRNRLLKGISCVIIDEAHERTLYTDLLLGMLKELIRPEANRLDFRIIITSATIDPSVFVSFFDFSKTAEIDVPGRAYPVKVIWQDNDVEIGWDYVIACVRTAIKIHIEEPMGDILVFLTSPIEIDEAIQKFKDLYTRGNMPELLSLHGKSDLKEQMLIFQPTPTQTRRIIFATNSAETSLTIPGIRYVIDSGMAKEMMYFPEKNKNSLVVTFINKSSAEQRKGRAGRTQPGVCYRMYSKNNFKEMPDRACPEILKTNLMKALLKIYQLGIRPECFDFVESPSKEAITRSLESMEHLGFVENHALTKLGKKVVELPVDPRLSKLILEGINCGIGYEATIIAAMVSEAGRLFVRFEETKLEADKKKVKFCQDTGDLCTYLEVYRRWREVARLYRFNWCLDNFISSKAMNSAAKTIEEILMSLHQELGIRVIRRYNNSTFHTKYESIIFNCFSENLCIFSGHAKVGYFSPYFRENLYIHPSSSLNYLGKDFPHFLVYSNLMQTSRNFLMDITPINEKTLNKACQLGNFNLQADMLKSLQILPKTLGPFGESILIRHVLGKGGSKITNLELMVEKLTKSRNFKIDVSVEKGTIDLYLEKRFHEKVCNRIQEIVNEGHVEMSKEEDVIKMSGGFSFFCLGASGAISDIIMPGEFRELIVTNVPRNRLENLQASLRSFGDLHSVRVTEPKKILRINATYMKVADAQHALAELRQKKFNVQSNVYMQENNEKPLPIYRLQLSWNRAVCDGTGYVEFNCEADKIQASSSLSKSFYIGNNYIYFTPSNISANKLNMTNLPSTVNEQMIKAKLQKALPSILKPKKIHFRCRKVPVSEEDMVKVKKQLMELFGPFAAPNNMVIDVSYPQPSSLLWDAIVYFMKPEDGERAFKQLSGNAFIGIVPVQIKAIRKAHLFCKTPIFEAVRSEIKQLERNYKLTTLSCEPKYNNTVIDLSFSCPSMKDLLSVRQNLVSLIQGRTIDCFGNKVYYYLFTSRGKTLVLKIQNRTHTYITLDNTRKSITVYGSRDNCSKARHEIQSLVKRDILCNKKVFNLKNSCMPSGFIKSLYVKYGLDLEGLISAFRLKNAYLDTLEGTLTIEGPETNINQAEGHLEEICCELYNKGQTVKVAKDNRELCTICLDPVNMDYYRLENCGHAFCRACLQLQVESKIFPLVCIHQNCGQNFFLIDIKKILSIGGESKRQSFYDAALQFHVNNNVGKISYCPTPDCNTVYRVTNIDAEFQCPSCENVICTHCQAPYHYGMSCDMYQNSEKDEDYSLKIYMQGNANVKQCPNCKVAIEKESGCNHMECLNCKTHMCWLCLETFPDGKKVYSHLPFCPKNQVVVE